MFSVCVRIRQHLIFVHVVGEIYRMYCDLEANYVYQEHGAIKPPWSNE